MPKGKRQLGRRMGPQHLWVLLGGLRNNTLGEEEEGDGMCLKPGIAQEWPSVVLERLPRLSLLVSIKTP